MVWASAGVSAERKAVFEEHGVYVRELPGTERGQVDLDAWKEWLSQQEFNEIHVEAGGRLNGAFVQAGLVEQVVAYVAPACLMPRSEERRVGKECGSGGGPA